MRIIACLLFALSACAPALDLSPSFADVFADGITLRRPYFADGAKKYAVTINAETEVLPYEDGALFKFTKLKNSEMRLRPSPFRVEMKFSPDTLDRYEEAARKLLPQAAKDVTLEQQTKNPLPVNGWESHRFVFKYTTPVGEVRESITFLNITPADQVVVQVSAPDRSFADASDRAFDIIRRWHELDAKAGRGGN